MLPYLAYAEQCFHAQAQPLIVRWFLACIVLLRDIEFYDVKHHNSYHLVCHHGLSQECFL